MTDFKTPQENFWSGDFGLEYSKRVSDDNHFPLDDMTWFLMEK